MLSHLQTGKLQASSPRVDDQNDSKKCQNTAASLINEWLSLVYLRAYTYENNLHQRGIQQITSLYSFTF